MARHTFANIFGTLSYLEEVTILGENMREFVDVLSAGVGIMFPSLLEIEIHGDTDWAWPEKEAILEELLDILMLRYEYGREVQSVRLKIYTEWLIVSKRTGGFGR